MLPAVLVYKDEHKYEFTKDSSLSDWIDEEMFTAIQPAKGESSLLVSSLVVIFC